MAEVSFGEWLKRRRKALGLTQEQFSRELNCSTITLRKFESEERRPSEQLVKRLADLFSIPPEERAAFLRFARGNLQPAPGVRRQSFPWQSSTKFPRSNLPAPLTGLIGREKEVAKVHEYLLDAGIRLVTLIGPPGVGKTRLGIGSAWDSLSDFPDGVFFVALAALDNAALIAPTVIRTLGYLEGKNRPALQQLVDGIADKQMLIVLDNCEHLIDTVAPLASTLLSGCPRIKILTTSREALRISGEWVYSVPALGVPREAALNALQTTAAFPALTLFAERARAVRSEFSLDINNIETVASICKQLDGLPLAIELIAARIRLMSPETLLARMNDQFILSANGMRAETVRQKTLSHAIGWSYDLLSDEERKLFAYLAVFSGGFTLEAAEAIFSRTAADKPIPDLITSLLDKSLLQRTIGQEAHSKPRFSMLVTIQQFALERLHQSGKESEARDWHLDHFLDLAEQSNQEIHGPAQVEWTDRLEKEMANFRGAFEWCLHQREAQKALRLVYSLSWFLGVWHHNNELRSWFERVRSLEGIDTHSVLYAQLLNQIGNSSWLIGDFQHARSVLEQSRTIWQNLDTAGEQGLAETLCTLGMVVHSIDADYQTAESLFKQSLDLYQQHGNQWGMALALFNLGWVNDHKNHDTTAQQFLEQSLDIFSQLGDLWGMGRSSRFLGQLFLKLGKYERARYYFQQHLEIDERLKFRSGIVIALGNLGDLYRFQGELDRAEEYFLKSLSMCREYGLRIDRGYNLYALGMLGLQRKDYSFARQYMVLYFESGSPVSRVLAACDLCMGLAAVAGGMKQPERCAKLYGAAQSLLQVIDIPYTPFDRVIFDQHIQMARSQLVEERFKDLVEEGRTMTMEHAISYALEEQHDLAH